MGALFKIHCANLESKDHEVVVNVVFHRGYAEVDSADDKQRAALSYFHKTPGYEVEPLSDVSVEQALMLAADPADEAHVLRQEIERLKAAREVDDLRAERNKLRAEVDERRAKVLEPGEQVSVTTGETIRTTDPDGPVDPPADTAPLAEWREWATNPRGGGMSEAEAATKSKSALVAEHGSAARAANGGS